MIVLWFALAIVLITIGVYWGFLIYASAKRILREVPDLEWDIKWAVYLGIFIGYPCDILYNATRGAWMFRRIDRWWFPLDRMFSWRIARLVREWNAMKAVERANLSHRSYLAYQRAIKWSRILNAGDPGHEPIAT